MQVHSLPSSDQKPSGPLRRHAARLIELMGTPKFETALFEAARETACCEHLTAFAFSDTAAPRMLLASNNGPVQIAPLVAEKYIFSFWTLDPVRRIESSKRGCNSDIGVRVQSDDIDNSDYRHECYTNVGLHDRISLIKQRDTETFRMSFYKATGAGQFTSAEVGHIFEAADLMMSLLAKHDAVSLPPRGTDSVRSFERRLKLVAKSLPKREVEVCTLIANGVSSEGIALKLGISLNTVLTHRKRAYARLGISSQNELLRLLLS